MIVSGLSCSSFRACEAYRYVRDGTLENSSQSLGLRVWELGSRVDWGLGFGVWDSWFREGYLRVFAVHKGLVHPLERRLCRQGIIQAGIKNNGRSHRGI
jgi:hypothetical protein